MLSLLHHFLALDHWTIGQPLLSLTSLLRGIPDPQKTIRFAPQREKHLALSCFVKWDLPSVYPQNGHYIEGNETFVCGFPHFSGQSHIERANLRPMIASWQAFTPWCRGQARFSHKNSQQFHSSTVPQ